MTSDQKSKTEWVVRQVIIFNIVAVIVLAGALCVYPPVRALLDLGDPALRGPGIPKAAWRLHQSLTPRYARWAAERVAAGRAERLSTRDISGTEWPLFGSVFYLWGVENLQAAWDAGDHRSAVEPRVFARDAIVAASELVIDPKHASWVKKHWGENYLHRENVFYRMLVIAALTSREKLLRDGAHVELLRDQVESFANELGASKTGLLDDYPAECYPGDVMAAIMCIKRADMVLGTDHSDFIARSLRGFTGAQTTRHQLPPYSASSGTGVPTSTARGCGNSYMCLTSPELWPEQAKEWYASYEKFFWQRRITAFGFREFPKDLPVQLKTSPLDAVPTIGAPAYREPDENWEWGMDVDAGPIISGHGVAASAFGLGAARKNGRFDHAYCLAAEMLVTVWELPGGVLAMPRLLSNASDAPLLGEAAILWLLSIQPEKGFAVRVGGVTPPYVYIVSGALLLIGAGIIWQTVRRLRQSRRVPAPVVCAPRLQVCVWACLILLSVVLFWRGDGLFGSMALLLSVALPVLRFQKRVSEEPAGQEKPAGAPRS